MVPTNLKTGWHHYYTFSMLLICGTLLSIVLLNIEGVWRNFETNIAVNGVIWSIIAIAMCITFYNNKKLRDTVLFLREIEKTEAKDNPTQEDIDYLKKIMRGKGRLLDTANMDNVLDRIYEMGFAQFTDKDAQLIKSKFGYRVRIDRGIVSYLAGMLVMLGLIGTFWGLLITIDSVGGAMVMVSESFGTGEQDIGGFLSSISTPLSGMGLAFSSSLFGLSGSLFLGFLNFFAGKTQNNIIEMFSRWADNHIPSMNPALKKEVGKANTPPSDDLKAWLAGYVFLSQKMNKQIQSLTQVVSKSAQASFVNSKALTEAMAKQTNYQNQLNEVTRLLSDIDNKMTKNANVEADQYKATLQSAETMERMGQLLTEIKSQTHQEAYDHNANMQQYDLLQKELSSVMMSIQNQVVDIQTLVNNPERYDVYDVMEKHSQDRANTDAPDKQ